MHKLTRIILRFLSLPTAIQTFLPEVQQQRGGMLIMNIRTIIPMVHLWDQHPIHFMYPAQNNPENRFNQFPALNPVVRFQTLHQEHTHILLPAS